MAYLLSGLYTLVFALAFAIGMPVWVWRRKRLPSGWRQRLGLEPLPVFSSGGSQASRTFWLHAVSVGEAMAAGALVRGLRTRYPDCRFVFTGVTPTGRSVLERLAGPRDLTVYVPFDFPFLARRFAKTYRPSMLILMETELWPGLLSACAREKIPAAVVNGRLSPKSFRSYHAFRFCLLPWLRCVRLWAMQTREDLERLLALGVEPSAAQVAGNLKFAPPESALAPVDWRGKLGLRPENKLWIAGSTHDPEESLILNTYKRLAEQFPFARLSIAPRHVERIPEIEGMLRAAGLSPVRFSKIKAEEQLPGNWEDPKQVLLVDTIGDLHQLYAAADWVFVGGSFAPRGGQNPIEPARHGKAVFFGPGMVNFQEIARLFLERGAALQMQKPAELFETVESLLSDPQAARRLGENAIALLADQSGVLDKTLEAVSDLESGIFSNPQIIYRMGFSGGWIRLIKGEENAGLAAGLFRALLLPLSWIYRAVISARNRAYEQGWLESRALDAPVASVGNLSWGGTGKTPLIAALSEQALGQGRRVAVLCRGYQVAGSATQAVPDETQWLRDSVKGLRVYAGSDRYASGAKALAEGPVDLFLLDDGFQHRRLKRGLDIVTIDAGSSWKSNRLIPAGIWREPLSSLSRADAVVLTCPESGGEDSLKALRERVRLLNPQALQVVAVYRSQALRGLGGQAASENPDWLRGKRVIAVSGIGTPENFERQLRACGAELPLCLRYRDHHEYLAADLDEILGYGLRLKADAVVCTEKDAVKLEKLLNIAAGEKTVPCMALQVRLELQEGREELTALLKSFQRAGNEKK